MDLPDGWLIDQPETPPIGWFLFAHGAGAPMDSDFMQALTQLLVERDLGVVRFEFPYMAEHRETGKRRPPNKMEVLLDSFQTQIDRVRSELAQAPLYIGGKSMGGRVASMLVQDNFDCGKVAGAVCLGYPFHPPGKPEKLRTEHLQSLTSPTLIVQGTRDKLGNREEVEGYALANALQVHWLEDGDHDFKPRKVSGFTQSQHWQAAADQMRQWMRLQES
ncbi:alpha/beta hydrolase [Microbulbifer agarilyticus]|uniref:alpha/beta family hydrolase n=1 Tax=Microbulbifer agarilyticus TaxID=260552 RepID=UPI001C986A16|nr:alpha/beta family hydrolase [Microbulbifer agarilyticus]MBY6189010.1 alpha/beta hydrolase [Microbulbifer agarilyticus]